MVFGNKANGAGERQAFAGLEFGAVGFAAADDRNQPGGEAFGPGQRAIAAAEPFEHELRPSNEDAAALFRSAARRVGTECVSTCSSRWSPYPSKTRKQY